MKSFSKYVFIIKEDAFNISIDTIPPQCNVKYSSKSITNQDVIVEIVSNEEIKSVDGFSLDNSSKVLSKTLEENESMTLDIYDLNNNKITVEYNVDWIDKEKPLIKVEEVIDGTSLIINFIDLYDLSGICKLEYYIDNRIVHIETGENLIMPQKYVYTNLKLEKEYEINIIATDNAGNITEVNKKIKI